MNISTAKPMSGDAALEVPRSPQASAGASLSHANGPSVVTPGSAGALIEASAGFTAMQTAASYVQATSGYLGEIKGILSRMAELSLSAKSSPGSASSAAGGAFAGLQGKLRAIVGGPLGEVGGVSGVPSPGATFDGSELFGSAEGQMTVTTGLSSMPTLAVGIPALRQGALLRLTARDSAGGFSAAASSPGMSSTISEALIQASSASDAMDRAQAAVDSASAMAQDGMDEAASALASSGDPAAATQQAAGAVLKQQRVALAAHSGVIPKYALGLLQAG